MVLTRVKDMTIPPNCGALADSGYSATCGTVDFEGGSGVWLVEHQTDTGVGGHGQVWLTRVYIHHNWYGLPSWGITDYTGPSPVHAANVTMTAMPLSSGSALLLLGIRFDDGTLRWDAVAGVPDDLPSLAGGSTDVVHGSVVIAGDQIKDYAGVCPEQGTLCTPTQFTVRTLAYSEFDHKLHVVSSAVVAGPAPAGVLP